MRFLRLARYFLPTGNSWVFGLEGSLGDRQGGIQVKGEVHGQGFPSHNFKGVRSALGYERVLTEHVHVKTEVSYISYDKNFDQLQTSLSFLYTF